MRLFDAHCHLDFMSNMDEVARDAAADGLHVLATTVTPQGYLRARDALAGLPNVSVAVGARTEHGQPVRNQGRAGCITQLHAHAHLFRLPGGHKAHAHHLRQHITHLFLAHAVPFQIFCF